MKLSDACLKRKRVVSEPVGFSVKRRKVTSGGSSVVLNGSNTVSSHGEQLFSDLTSVSMASYALEYTDLSDCMTRWQTSLGDLYRSEKHQEDKTF